MTTNVRAIEASQRYKSGDLASKIARDMGVKPATVFNWLKLTGTPVDKRVALTPREEQQLMEQYQAGVRVPELLTQFNINAGTLRNIRIRHGVTPRNRLPHPLRSYTDETVDKIVQDYLNGASQADIGTEYKVSQSSISRILYQRGVVKTDLRPRREHHGKWKGGRSVLESGYILVRIYPEDPFFSEMAVSHGYVLEHRYVMAKALGRALTPGETVHHIDGDNSNNSLENLQLRQGKHGKGTAMACLDCGSQRIGSVPLS